MFITINKRYRLTPYLKRRRSRAEPTPDCSVLNVFSMNWHDSHKDAVTLLALLRTDEDRLVELGKQLVKKDKAYAQVVFSTLVDGWTPFHAFVLRGARKMVKLSLKSGVSVNLEMGNPEGLPGECSPLHLAAHRGDVSIISILVESGAELNKRDSEDKTPIYYASRAHNTLAVKTLKRAGADVSTCDPEHKSSASEDMPSRPIICFIPFSCAGIRR